MQVSKDIWDWFMDQNNFDFCPIFRNPMTGQFPVPGDQMMELAGDKKEPFYKYRPMEFMDIPDDWVLPITRKGLPPKPNQKIDRYILSEEGVVANRERLKKGYRYKKCSFEEYVKVITSEARHYKKTLARRNAKDDALL